MQETFIVTVKTDDGKCFLVRRIFGDSFTLYSLLLQLSNVLESHLEVTQKLKTSLGSGTGQSASDSSLSTDS